MTLPGQIAFALNVVLIAIVVLLGALLFIYHDRAISYAEERLVSLANYAECNASLTAQNKAIRDMEINYEQRMAARVVPTTEDIIASIQFDTNNTKRCEDAENLYRYLRDNRF